ncbi:MAG: hypothetical protein IJ191_10170 [Treponema sp.]|nr:hypothetical protein [Treponema sp.]
MFKKTVFMAVFTLAVCPMVRAQAGAAESISPYLHVQELINSGLSKNRFAINSAAQALTPDERTALYDANAISASTKSFGVGLAGFLGWGIGSWVEHDKVGGLIGTFGYLGCTIAEIASVTAWIVVAKNSGSGEKVALSMYGGFWGLIISGLIHMVFWIGGMARASFYPQRYNSTLRAALSSSSRVSVVPSVQVYIDKEQKTNVSLSATVHL